jgi:DNA (cytosine-5)-methyltransferase 1
MGTFIELYAGIGLVRHGLEKAGWTCLRSNDICPRKASIYEENFKERMEVGDVRKLPEDFFGGADLITASFPCQDFSLSGKRRGFEGEMSGSILHVLKAVGKLPEALKPRGLMFENVPGFLNDKEAASQLLRLCASVGFPFIYMRVIDASVFTPQIRKRMFIIAAAAYTGPIATTPSWCKEEAVVFVDEVSFGKPSPVPPFPAEDSSSKVLEDERDGFHYLNARELLDNVSPRHHERLLNLPDGSFCAVTVQGASKGNKYHVHPTGKCACLRAANHYVYIARKWKGTCIMRRLTLLECSRMQGADGFRIPGSVSYARAYTAFGEAVCSPVITWLGLNVLPRLIPAIQT